VRRVLLHPIPAAELDRLVVAWEIDPARDGSLIEVSLPYFQDWRAQSRSFADMAAFGSVNWSHELKGPPARETVPAAFVSASFFDTLRVHALLGRTFLPPDDEPGAGRVLLLSYGLWQRRFGGDPRVVGTKAEGGDEPFTIIGVMPPGFDFPQGAQVWTPVGPALDADRRRNHWTPAFFRSLGVLYVVGRLKDGVTPDAARAELAGLSRGMSVADRFSTTGGWGARVVPLVDHHLGASTRQALQALPSPAVPPLACANAAVLLLVQAIRRRTWPSAGRSAPRSATSSGRSADSALRAGRRAGGTRCSVARPRGGRVDRQRARPGRRRDRWRRAGLLLLVTSAVAVVVALAPSRSRRLAIAPALSREAPGRLDRHGFQRLLVAAGRASIVLLVGRG
jgi:hypothetical protein